MKKKTRKKLRKWIIPSFLLAAFIAGMMTVYLERIFFGHLNLVENMNAVIQAQQEQLDEARRAPAPRAPAPAPTQ